MEASNIAPGVTVKGNRELLAQALSNLLDNAVKYAGDAVGAEIKIALQRDRDGVKLVVADNGPGIPEDRREDAVRRFVRLDESRSKPGTGLGLSLVHAVTALHGGRLDLTHTDPAVTERPGLTVTITLPEGKA
jgi:Osmosensitive K+ channel histidine kinase